jgi:isopropylmalate/homocitrate/citramalate synthase
MQGEGMTLTAAEKVRVVHKLDELGIDLIEAASRRPTPRSSSCSRCWPASRCSTRRSSPSA